MSDYRFFTAYLRFVAMKTDKEDPDVAAMMAVLNGLADDIDKGANTAVARDDLALAGRALAGFAGFLQKQILPEAVAQGHSQVESQLRWAIDTAMEMMTRCLSHAELVDEEGALMLSLPPPPDLNTSA